MQRHSHPQWFIKNGTRWQSRFPKYAAEGRVAVGKAWELYGPQMVDTYRVFALDEDGFIKTPSEDLDGVAVREKYYVRQCDLETISPDNFLYVLPRR